ncbi:MAG: hypothetical protein ACRDJX_05885 [Solirubrobacteraceae bacterium]
MIFATSRAISARLYNFSQRFAPSNIVIRRAQTRTGAKWGPLVGLTGTVLYGLLMLATTTIVRKGGPGWGELVVLVAFWNTAKFAWLIPVSLIRLLHIRHQERLLLRDRPRTSTGGRAPAGVDPRSPAVGRQGVD